MFASAERLITVGIDLKRMPGQHKEAGQESADLTNISACIHDNARLCGNGEFFQTLQELVVPSEAAAVDVHPSSWQLLPELFGFFLLAVVRTPDLFLNRPFNWSETTGKRKADVTLELMTQSVLLSRDAHTQTCTNEQHGSSLQSLQHRITKFQWKPVHRLHQSHVYEVFFCCISMTLINNNSNLTWN